MLDEAVKYVATIDISWAFSQQLNIGSNCITHPGVIIMKDLPDNSVVTIGGKVKGSFDPITIA